jgi:hypothetical protein
MLSTLLFFRPTSTGPLLTPQWGPGSSAPFRMNSNGKTARTVRTYGVHQMHRVSLLSITLPRRPSVCIYAVRERVRRSNGIEATRAAGTPTRTVPYLPALRAGTGPGCFANCREAG